MATNNWVSLLDFQAVVSNNRSIIKTDGSGLTLLATRPALVAQPCSSQPDNSPSPVQQQENAPCFCAVLGTVGMVKNRGIALTRESGAEQCTPILVLCSKYAEKSKETQVDLPQNISALFRLMVLTPWLIFSLETSKRKKKTN